MDYRFFQTGRKSIPELSGKIINSIQIHINKKCIDEIV